MAGGASRIDWLMGGIDGGAVKPLKLLLGGGGGGGAAAAGRGGGADGGGPAGPVGTAPLGTGPVFVVPLATGGWSPLAARRCFTFSG